MKKIIAGIENTNKFIFEKKAGMNPLKLDRNKLNSAIQSAIEKTTSNQLKKGLIAGGLAGGGAGLLYHYAKKDFYNNKNNDAYSDAKKYLEMLEKKEKTAGMDPHIIDVEPIKTNSQKLRAVGGAVGGALKGNVGPIAVVGALGTGLSYFDYKLREKNIKNILNRRVQSEKKEKTAAFNIKPLKIIKYPKDTSMFNDQQRKILHSGIDKYNKFLNGIIIANGVTGLGLLHQYKKNKETHEKTALLADLYKNKKLKNFSKAFDLKTKNRIKNTADVELKQSIPQKLQSIPSFIKQNIKDFRSDNFELPAPPYSTLHSHKNKTRIFLPKEHEIESTIKTTQNKPKIKSKDDINEIHNSFINHELDESQMKPDMNKNTFTGYKSKGKFYDFQKRISENLANKIVDSSYVKKKILDMGINHENFKNQVQDNLKHLNLKKQQTAGHMGPEILLHESNRTFHEATPKVKEYMTELRKNTGEHDYLRRNLGLRYGDEYIPPNGRRWNSIVNRSAKDVDPNTGFIELDRKLKQKNEYLKKIID